MPAKEGLIRKKIRERAELTGESTEQFERELIPHAGEELRPVAVRKRRITGA